VQGGDDVTTISIPALETARLTLRAPCMGDFDAFAACIASPRARFIGGPSADDKSVWRAFAHMAGLWVLRGYGPFVWCLKDGTPIGSGGPWFPRGLPEPEFGWMLWSRDHEGKGYATEAMQSLIGWSFATLGLSSLVAYIDPANAASVRVAQRLGAVEDPDAETPHGGNVLVYRFTAEAA
jgi:RimJ/RimL family protein N-acetyltransferase